MRSEARWGVPKWKVWGKRLKKPNWKKDIQNKNAERWKWIKHREIGKVIGNCKRWLLNKRTLNFVGKRGNRKTAGKGFRFRTRTTTDRLQRTILVGILIKSFLNYNRSNGNCCFGEILSFVLRTWRKVLLGKRRNGMGGSMRRSIHFEEGSGLHFIGTH